MAAAIGPVAQGKYPRHVLVGGSAQDDDLGLVEHLLLVPGEFRPFVAEGEVRVTARAGRYPQAAL
jgi:hypothetical protein